MRDFEKPGRSLAISRTAMAATSHPASTMTAVEIMKSGGNAMDAAVAACAVQCVVEAGSTGIGGDCFTLFSMKGSPEPIAYNGSGRTPFAANRKWYQQQNMKTIDRQSPHAVTVPGAIEAWARLLNDYGRLTFAEVLSPAISMAREGYPVTQRVAFDIGNQARLLEADDEARRTFLVAGKAPVVGDIQKQPKLADTLELIGREGPSAFYSGDIAAEMVGFLQAKGGLHAMEDFTKTRGEYVKPIWIKYRGRKAYECPPSGQGVIALLILNILSRFRRDPDPLNVDNLHIEVEATRLAYAARDAFVADTGVSDVPVDYLLSDRLAEELAQRIDLSRAIEHPSTFAAVEHSDTVYITTVDKDRNCVSFINSLFHPYGAGLMTPRSGVMFHNRGQSFVVEDGHPNAIGPRKRPMHTIIPGMVVENGRPCLSFGVMGGHYQAMGHAHYLSKLFDHGLDLQAAMDLPRLFPIPGTNIVEAEEGVRIRVEEAFKKRGFKVQPPRWPIGGAQAIWIDRERDILIGASDHRKDGCALGY
jgi:gamma-glutamyltranspeptidase / glutathione hydrolase